MHGTDSRVDPAIPSPAEAASIVQISGNVVRNLRITHFYHEIAVAFSRLLDEKNVTWCAYATWASKNAGSFIREEGIDVQIQRYLDHALVLDDILLHFSRDLRRLRQNADFGLPLTMEIISIANAEVVGHIAYGNLIVFEELGPIFAHFLEVIHDAGEYDEADLQRVLKPLKPGRVEDGGQDLLVQAFSSYYSAKFEQDSKRRAEAIFLANALVGYHEQIRLQGPIVNAMRAPFDEDVEAQVLAKAGERLKFAPRLIRRALEFLWRRRLRKLAVLIAGDWREISTEWLMVLKLPAETLLLGSDVSLPSSGRPFPGELEDIENPQLRSLLQQVDRSPDSLAGSAAQDWGKVDERMNYIVDLFRSRQQESDLLTPPFSAEQVGQMRREQLPDGEL